MIHRTLFFVFLFTLTVLPQQNKDVSDLNSNYQMKIGDYCALLLNDILKSNYSLDAPINSTFDIENSTIDLKIFGARGRVESARETLNLYWDNIEVSFIPYVENRFNVSLDKNDFEISYYDRTNNYKLILQLLDGQIVVP